MTHARRPLRPVRIHALPASTAPPADTARRSRFAKLYGSKRTAGADEQHAPASHGADADCADAPPDDSPAPRDTAVSARMPATPRERDMFDMTGWTSRVALACLHENLARLVAERIAARIAEFCNTGAVRQNGVWSAHLRLDPNLLPDTTLSMELSPDRLRLRFQTSNVLSRQLICTHQDTLRTTLETGLHGHCELDIDVA